MSENIDYLGIDFGILEIEKILEKDDFLNFIVSNYKFYDCFFSEIYNGFYKNMRDILKGTRYISDLIPEISIPLDLKLEEIDLGKYQIAFQIYIRENAVFAISDIYAIIFYIFIVSVNKGRHA